MERRYPPQYPSCGGDLTWDSDYMSSDIDGVDLPEEDDYVVNMWSCSRCGAQIEVRNLSPNEQAEFEKQKNGTTERTIKQQA